MARGLSHALTTGGMSSGPWCQYLGDQEILVRLPTHWMIVPGWDLSLTPSILAAGNWEPELTEVLRGWVRPDMAVLDVGAHCGWFSAVCAAVGADVHAFEPNPRLQPFLRKNIFLNAGPRTPRCGVHACVLGDEDKVVPMRFPHWLAGGAGLHNSDQSHFLDSLLPETIDVPMTSVDAFVARRNLERVGIIKIDVEGHEEAVIRGARETIRRSSGLLLALEYTRGRYTPAFPAVLGDLFASLRLLPENRPFTRSELEAYERGELLPDRPLLELLGSNI